MKKSIYIVDYESEDGKYYMMHTASGNIVAIDVTKKAQLQQILDDPNAHQESVVCSKLTDSGFIVPESVNEYQIVTGKHLLRNFCKNHYLELTIMPTEQCNFRCVYCYEDFVKPKMNEETIDSIIRYVEKNISNHKGLVVSWFGGEPLLAMDVIEKLSKAFIRICRENRKIYSSSITTNAFLLNLDAFEKLRKWRINHFQITIDGNKMTHDKQRVQVGGGGTFDQRIYNIKNISENGKSNLWTISLRTNVTNSTVQNIEQFKKEIVDSFNDDPRVYIMLRKMWTNNTDDADALVCSEQDFERFVSQCEISETSLYQEYIFAHDMNFMCYASNPNSYVIGSDGKVYKCTYALYDDINQIGQLKTAGEMCLNEEKLSFWIAPRATNKTECMDCANYAACVSNGCPYRQNELCYGKTLDILKCYIPQFFKLAENAEDLSAYL